MKLFISIIFCLSLNLPFASAGKQPGYIILKGGDTLWGLVKTPFPLDDKQAYKLYDSLGNKAKFYPADMIGYGRIEDGEMKDYIKFKTGRALGKDIYIFLPRILKGKICVYRYEIADLGSMDLGKPSLPDRIWFYLVNDDGIEFLVKFNSLFRSNKKELQDALSGCPSVMQKLDGKLTEEKTLELIKEYNSCENEKPYSVSSFMLLRNDRLFNGCRMEAESPELKVCELALWRGLAADSRNQS